MEDKMGIGDIFSGIASVGAAIVGAVVSIAEHVGPMIGECAKVIMEKIKDLDIDIPKCINMIGDIVEILTKIFDIDSEPQEVLGAKAEQAEKTIEDFDNDTIAYINYLKNEIQLDKEKFNSLSQEEKLGYKVTGIAIESQALSQKMGIEITPDSLVLIPKLESQGINIDVKTLVKIFEVLEGEGIQSLNDVSDLLEGKGDSDRIKTGEALTKALTENTDLHVSDLKDAVREFNDNH
jgi:hypothetical protein